jgi:hypothetical protein
VQVTFVSPGACLPCYAAFMESKTIKVTFNLPPDLRTLLLTEQGKRKIDGRSDSSLEAMILDAIRQTYGAGKAKK